MGPASSPSRPAGSTQPWLTTGTAGAAGGSGQGMVGTGQPGQGSDPSSPHSPSNGSSRTLSAREMYLFDTGGQYL